MQNTPANRVSLVYKPPSASVHCSDMKRAHIPSGGGLALSLFLGFLLLGVVPLTSNFVSDSKLYGFVGGVLVLFLAYLFQSLRRNELLISLSPFSVVSVALLFSNAASVFFTSNYPVENLLGLGGVYLTGSLFMLFGDRLLTKRGAEFALQSFIGINGFLAVTVLLERAGFGPSRLYNLLPNVTIPADILFNLSGSNLLGLEVMSLAVLLIVLEWRRGTFQQWVLAVLPLLLVAMGIQLYAILPGKNTSVILPNMAADWSIVLDVIRSPRQALIGVGSGNYINAFNQFKPTWLNGTENWAVEFSQARNLPLNALATTGFVGLGVWVWFMIRTLRVARVSQDAQRTVAYTLLVLFGILFFLPPATVMIAILSVLVPIYVALSGDDRETISIQAFALQHHSPHRETQTNVSNYALTVLVGMLTIATGAGLYFVGRAYAAANVDLQAANAIAEDEAVRTYELQQRVIELNPFLDVYRRNYSSTNLLIAIALSNKADATEQETAQVATLLQQAIREGRAATTLDPNDVRNWMTLGQTYENMIGAAADAEQFAIQTYVNAIETSPANPTIRVRLAQVLESQEQFSQAANLYNQAINLKPDLAAPHYQLARLLLGQEQYLDARTQYQRLLAILDEGTPEHTQITAELEELEAQIEELGLNQAAQQGGAGAVPGTPPAGQVPPATGQAPTTPATGSILEQQLDNNPNTLNEADLDNDVNIDNLNQPEPPAPENPTDTESAQ